MRVVREWCNSGPGPMGSISDMRRNVSVDLGDAALGGNLGDGGGSGGSSSTFQRELGAWLSVPWKLVQV